MRAVEVGHRVVGFDASEELATGLTSGFSHVEDVSAAQVKSALATGRYRVTSRPETLGDFDVAVITVPTPICDGTPDLSYIEAAGKTIAPSVRPGSTVILESTTYPGTTEELLVPILEDGSGLTAGHDFHVGYSPERIDPGNDTWDLVNIPKVVSGIDPRSLEAVRSFYATLVERTVPVSGTKEAELTKLLENTFRHVNVALVNELAMFAYDLGIDLSEAIEAAATKPFGFMPFRPGPGVGGHCLPIDPSYLSWQVRRRLGHGFRFVELANDVNAGMSDYVVRRIVVGLNQRQRAVHGSRILLLGLSYKRNLGDGRESPALRVAEQLLALGANVRAADPYVGDHVVGPRIVRIELSPEELTAADAVVVLTDHDVFDFDLIATHGQYVLDTRHRVEGPTVEQL
ncbi:MAG: nucleotide sugar dehydrogenase [Actinomycetota bacterium]|nr:nucleotide sugar dehydrogenase [Actinomycetota bacterium]